MPVYEKISRSDVKSHSFVLNRTIHVWLIDFDSTASVPPVPGSHPVPLEYCGVQTPVRVYLPTARQLRDARHVVWVEAVLLETLRANRGLCQRRVHLIPCPIDGDTLQALAKIRVRRVRVG